MPMTLRVLLEKVNLYEGYYCLNYPNSVKSTGYITDRSNIVKRCK